MPNDALQFLTAAQPESLPFWEASAKGRFLLPHCTACHRAHWYPRAMCPLCGSASVEWREASGRGTVYSVSVVRRANPPYALAYVTLDEGPTMLTNIVDCDLDSVAIGQAVKVVLRARPDGVAVPLFTPA
jgi:uncharacterized OB-fold protein